MITTTRPLLVLALVCAAVAAPARGDQLRNVKPGQSVPEFSMPSLDGKELASEALHGKVTVIVYISAQQKSSEAASQAAHDIVRRLRNPDVALVFATADVLDTAYLRERRDALNIHEPLGLDLERKLYGDLGLIVLPTTIVIDRAWRLAHVISAKRSDYDHRLATFIRHALGEIDDAGLAKAMETQQFRRDLPEQRIARHRAAADHLRKIGLMESAENEIRAALEIDPTNIDARLDLASLALADERVDEADEVVITVLADDPDQRRAKLMRAVILYERDRLDEAEVALRELLLLNPDPVHTHYYLGLVYEKKGDMAKAAEHYRQAMSRLIEDRPL